MNGTYLENLQLPDEIPFFNHPISTLIFHADVALKFGENSTIQPLQFLMQNPSLLLDWYLPTMPVNFCDLINDPFSVWGNNYKVYECPQGHLYAIGECGEAVEKSKCPDCGEIIGGKDHKSTTGNKIVDFEKYKTKPGYLAKKFTEKKTCERMTDLQFFITDIVLLLTLFIVANSNIEIVRKVIFKDETDETDPVDFLLKHVKGDLENIEKCYNISSESSCTLLHIVISKFFTRNGQACPIKWNTSENRLQWEKIFIEQIVNPSLRELKEGENLIMKDDRLAKFPFFLNLIEIQSDLSHKMPSLCTSSWKNYDFHNLEKIITALKQKELDSKIEFLIFTLSQINYICAIKYLPSLIALMNSTIIKIQGKFSRSTLKKIKIDEYFERFITNGKKYY